MADETAAINSIELATELAVAWLSNPNTNASVDDVPAFLQKLHSSVTTLSSPASETPAEQPAEYTPAVSVRKSLASKDHILSLIDGKPYKTLRRHLGTHGLTPEQYRQRYGLKPDYPLVSESYSKSRQDIAKKLGLGRKSAAKSGAAVAKPASAPAKKASRGRPKKAAAPE